MRKHLNFSRNQLQPEFVGTYILNLVDTEWIKKSLTKVLFNAMKFRSIGFAIGIERKIK